MTTADIATTAKPKRVRKPVDPNAPKTPRKPRTPKVAAPANEVFQVDRTRYAKNAEVLWNWPKANPTHARVVGVDHGRFVIRFSLMVNTKYGMQEVKHQVAVYPASLRAVL